MSSGLTQSDFALEVPTSSNFLINNHSETQTVIVTLTTIILYIFVMIILSAVSTLTTNKELLNLFIFESAERAALLER